MGRKKGLAAKLKAKMAKDDFSLSQPQNSGDIILQQPQEEEKNVLVEEESKVRIKEKITQP